MVSQSGRFVFLDFESIPKAPLDFSALEAAAPNLERYEETSPENVLDRVRGARVIITNKVPIGPKEMDEAGASLGLIVVAATGYNVIDIEEAKKRGISVCNVPSYSTDSVRQHTFLLMLALVSNFLGYQALIHRGEWQKSRLFCLNGLDISELYGKTLGLVGSGAIGQSVAEVAKVFGMSVIFAERKKASSARLGYVPFDDFLKRSDIISLHCPLNTETKDLITIKELQQMKPSALIINTARGGIINESDLYQALKKKIIAGAAVDVLTEEPPSRGNLLLEEALPNLIVTPHVAWSSRRACQQLIDVIANNILAFQAGTIQNQIC